jgi:hypothetical protein
MTASRTASNATTPIDTLPPEILQEMWGHMSFYDLIRCQRVCKKWTTYLPGNNPTLRGSLFSPTSRRFASEQQNTYDDLRIWIEISQHMDITDKALPRLSHNIEIYNPEAYQHDTDGSGGHHPIVCDIDGFCDSIHPCLKPGPPYTMFRFNGIEDVQLLAKKPKPEEASWAQMLAFVPKVREVQLNVERRVNAGDHAFPEPLPSYEVVLRNENGVTVLDVVKAV